MTEAKMEKIAADMLLPGMTMKGIAERNGISDRTLRNLRKTEAFQRVLATARAEAFERVFDLLRQIALDALDALGGEVGFVRIDRVGHHVNMRMVTFVMECGVPAEVRWCDLHLLGNHVPVRAEQMHPGIGCIVAQSFRILTAERDDMCPDISGMFIHLFLNLRQHNGNTLVREQAVAAGTLVDVLEIHIPLWSIAMQFHTHCGACMKPCQHPECRPFGRCVHACVNGCLSIAGEEISAEQLAQRLRKCGEILKRMDGGITLSGGEPMLQADFVCELAEELGDFHKAIQTSGYAEPKTYQKVINCVNYVMQDIKLVDTQAHIRYTGVSNGRILENIEWLKASGKDCVFRVPLIPGITDTEENLKGISKIVGSFRTELLPYNSLAGAKYPMLGMEYSLPDGNNRREDFTRFFANAVLLFPQ